MALLRSPRGLPAVVGVVAATAVAACASAAPHPSGARGAASAPAASAPTAAASAAAGPTGGTVRAPAALPSAVTGCAPQRVAGDWTRFDYDAARSGRGPASSGIRVADLAHLHLRRVTLDDIVDSSPILLHAVRVGGRSRDVAFVTARFGRTYAIDVATGQVLWRFTPPGYATWAGTYRYTTATPIADPTRRFVYATSPNGLVHRLDIRNGHEAAGWPIRVTRLPQREKLTPPLNLTGCLLLVGTGGYIGDAPPYQGHVVAIDIRTHRIVHVLNTLCSDRHTLLVPSACPESDSAVWGKGTMAVDPMTHNILIATGNARFDGRRYWGDSVLMLAPDASRIVQSYTPASYQQLQDQDLDLGSASPAILPGRLALQGGKDGRWRLLDLRHLNGRDFRLGRVGGELQTIRTPGGDEIFSHPAVYSAGGTTWVFVADTSGTAAYKLVRRRLRVAWQNGNTGTSPVVSGGLVWIASPYGGLRVYRPGSGTPITTLPTGGGHWNSPIAILGRVILPEGNSNDDGSSHVIDIWSR